MIVTHVYRFNNPFVMPIQLYIFKLIFSIKKKKNTCISLTPQTWYLKAVLHVYFVLSQAQLLERNFLLLHTIRSFIGIDVSKGL